jgi:hypothetical protein
MYVCLLFSRDVVFSVFRVKNLEVNLASEVDLEVLVVVEEVVEVVTKWR